MERKDKMSDKIDFDEWEPCDNDMHREDQLDVFYDQLRAWAQKNAEARKLKAEADAELRLLRTYAGSNDIDMTALILPEGQFVWQERHRQITKELLLKYCDGLVREEIVQQLCDRINASEVKKYQIFQQKYIFSILPDGVMEDVKSKIVAKYH